MNHLKHFKIFERFYPFRETDSWKSNSSVSHYVEYGFETGKWKYVCVFNDVNGQYVREYFCDNRVGDPYSKTDDDVWGVVGTVTEITYDFISRYHPEILKINHIREKGETGYVSKRAKVHRRFLLKMLDRLPDYDIKFYGDTTVIMRVLR